MFISVRPKMVMTAFACMFIFHLSKATQRHTLFIFRFDGKGCVSGFEYAQNDQWQRKLTAIYVYLFIVESIVYLPMTMHHCLRLTS